MSTIIITIIILYKIIFSLSFNYFCDYNKVLFKSLNNIYNFKFGARILIFYSFRFIYVYSLPELMENQSSKCLENRKDLSC
jgi:hypothetical protein